MPAGELLKRRQRYRDHEPNRLRVRRVEAQRRRRLYAEVLRRDFAAPGYRDTVDRA